MRARVPLRLGVLLFLSIMRPSAAAAPAGESPYNVLLIVIDSLRADHLGAYGHPRAVSPNIDALARRGARLDAATAQSNWTLPSVASLMTSVYPSVHGAIGHSSALSAQATTLASVFGRHGYRTAGIVSGAFVRKEYGVGRGFETYLDRRPGIEATKSAARAWLAENPSRKFFLYLHLYDVHAPYGGKLARKHARDPDYSGPANGSLEFLSEVSSGKIHPTPRDVRRLEDLYDGGLLYTDLHLGEIFAALESLALSSRTIVVLTSDHGESLVEHGARTVHGTSPYQEELRVPLIFAGPRIPASTIAAPVELIDVAPTVLAMTGLPIPRAFAGTSMAPLLAGLRVPDKTAFSQPAGGGGQVPALLVGAETARTRTWKLIAPKSGPPELFDLSSDPKELRDVARENPAIVESLRAALSAWRAKTGRAKRFYAQPPEMDTGLEESLRAAGYLK